MEKINKKKVIIKVVEKEIFEENTKRLKFLDKLKKARLIRISYYPPKTKYPRTLDKKKIGWSLYSSDFPYTCPHCNSQNISCSFNIGTDCACYKCGTEF